MYYYFYYNLLTSPLSFCNDLLDKNRNKHQTNSQPTPPPIQWVSEAIIPGQGVGDWLQHHVDH